MGWVIVFCGSDNPEIREDREYFHMELLGHPIDSGKRRMHTEASSPVVHPVAADVAPPMAQFSCTINGNG